MTKVGIAPGLDARTIADTAVSVGTERAVIWLKRQVSRLEASTTTAQPLETWAPDWMLDAIDNNLAEGLDAEQWIQCLEGVISALEHGEHLR